MISAQNDQPAFRTLFSDGRHEAYADTTADKGGSGAGFRPHDLLEAALATCLNMEVRIYATHHGVPLSEVHTEVRLDRSQAGETIFEYAIRLEGPLSEAQRQKLLQVAKACSVHKTLSKRLSFRQIAAPLRD